MNKEYIPPQDFSPGAIVNKQYILCQYLFKDIPAKHVCVKKPGDIDMFSIWAAAVKDIEERVS